MSIEILECEQGSEAWHRARMGIPTSSEFATVLARGKDGGASLTRAKYLRRLAGEIITGAPAETYSNAHMERGKAMEEEARDLYCFLTNAEPQRVGFVRNGQKGCSPDSLIGEDGMLEIKTALPDILIEKIERDDFPPEHKAQTQGGLWVAKREWIDLVVYWPKMPLFKVRAKRDEVYIAKLASEVDRFNDDLAALVERIKAYGERSAA